MLIPGGKLRKAVQSGAEAVRAVAVDSVAALVVALGAVLLAGLALMIALNSRRVANAG